MLDVSETEIGEKIVTKRFRPWNAACRPFFEAEREFAPILAANDLGPKVISIGAAWIVYEKGTPLTEYLKPGPAENRWAGEALLRGIRRLHALGIAHRDIQIGNLLLARGGEIHFIDTELACRIDPKANPLPYAIYGPERSGIPAPETHQAQGLAAFWNSETVDDAPWRRLGRIEEYGL